ncbi:MAG TPA: vWA domain-containing protein [Polyangia bacterium]|nr:vWA domain-containing protein [Polyangia bacterium]
MTKETKWPEWVSAGLIIGAMCAGLGAMAANRHALVAPPVPASIVAAPAPIEIAAPPKSTTPAARPRVDLVFALDTTGSMSGLIEGAKAKIWSIASFVARAQPTPDVRVGLVAYRDIGDAYVTRVYDLDSDLDRVYRRLLSFKADGGGDTPEHVARALHEAVHAMSWAPRANNDVRLIYLVGDAPPHLDYDDGYDYAKAARAAAAKGIQIHAIRCGNDPETGTVWRRIASLGHGEFLTIDQDGGMRERRTPYDGELAKLHDELSDTVVAYGGAKGAATRAALEAAAAAPAPVKAARAGFLSAKKADSAVIADDLVGGVSSGRVDLANVPAAELPAGLAGLKMEERKEKIAADAKARSAILDRIAKVSKDRDAFLSRQPADKAEGFDGEVEKTVRKAGAAAGLAF